MYSSCSLPALFDGDIAHRAVEFRADAFTDGVATEVGVTLPEKMAKAVAKRKAEYVGGRLCAMQAIAACSGQQGTAVSSGDHGQPVWPQGLVGSITHTHGFAAAAVGKASRFAGIGMDTEQVMTAEVMHNVRARICGPEDKFSVGSPFAPELYATLVFSAKESLFKCLYPLVGKMFWFEDALIRLLPGEGGFTAELLSRLSGDFPAGRVIKGRFCLTTGLVHTGIQLANSVELVI